MTDMSNLGPRHLPDWLLARGRNSFTTSEAAQLMGVPEHHVAASLASLRHRGQLFSPAKGLYVVVPPEFRSWKVVPASHFVDPMMRHLEHAYYVCLLSAAEIHGYAHQRPQVFQVMTSARLRDREFGRVRIEFFTSRHTQDRPIDEVNTPTGTMSVSTLEATLLDLVSFPNRSGGLFNIATVIGDVLDDDGLDVERLAEAAGGYPASVVQRTGWLVDYMASQLQVEVDTDPLTLVAARRPTPTPLDPSYGRSGTLDQRWNVIVAEYPEEEST